MSDYEKQAHDFADKHNLTMTAQYLGHYPRLFDDQATANFLVTLTRPNRRPMTFEFSASIHDSWEYFDENGKYQFKKIPGLPSNLLGKYKPKTAGRFPAGRFTFFSRIPKPSLYSILACLTHYEPGTFENFCGDCGYDEDSRKAFDIYQAVLKEWGQVSALFGDCLEELAEIN